MISAILLSFIGFSSPEAIDAKDPLFYNKKIIEFVDNNIGKKVYEGENVDLCLEALKFAGAKQDFSSEYIYGKELNLRKTDIAPGDFIHFDDAEFEIRETKVGWKFRNQSIIVYKVMKNNVIKFAAQNLFNKPLVIIDEIDLKSHRRGYYKVYRAMPPTPVVKEQKKEEPLAK